MSSGARVVWASGAAYEPFIGRWSRRVAREFLTWLAVPPQRRWLDIGVGTGALTQTIIETTAPAAVLSVDRSPGYIDYARRQIRDSRAQFVMADARALSAEAGSFDAAVSGLVINFVPQPEQMISEMVRVARPGAVVAAYVWDYVGKMQLLGYFWNAVAALDPSAADVDEVRRFPICQPGPLSALWRGAGLRDVDTRALDVVTRFRDFDDYWSPFLGGQGPAAGYAMSLSEERRAVLRDHLRRALPTAPDGAISLIARAWGVRGYR